MMSYDTILHVCELCGDEVCRKFFGEPNSNPHGVGAEPPVSVAASFSVEVFE